MARRCVLLIQLVAIAQACTLVAPYDPSRVNGSAVGGADAASETAPPAPSDAGADVGADDAPPAPSPPSPHCSAGGWCLSYPTATHYEGLTDVWGSGPTDVFAVGERGAVLHHDGATWSRMSTPAPTGTLRAVWGSGPARVFAVGIGGAALRYDGTRWSTEPLPTGMGLYDVWGVGATDVYAVGRAGTVVHHDGKQWRKLQAGTLADLYGVWATEGHVFVVGAEGTVLHHDVVAGAWRVVARGGADLHAIWGRGPDEVYAAGAGGTLLRCSRDHCSSRGSGSTALLQTLWGTPEPEGPIWAAGASKALLRCDGEGCASVAVEDTGSSSLRGVWGSGVADIFAVGQEGLIAHFDGQAWSRHASGLAFVQGVWSGGGEIYAIAAPFFPGGPRTHVLRRDGAAWTTVAVHESPGFPNAIWGSGPDDIHVADGNGTMLHYDGASWSVQALPLQSGMVDLWGSGADDVFAVGAQGAILHFDGIAWSPMSSNVAVSLAAVWGAAPNDVFAAGTQGTILHYDGTAWTVQATGGAHLRAIWGTGPTEVIAVGASGTMLRYDGVQWRTVFSGTTTNLAALWGSGPDDIYVAGVDELLHYDGNSWSRQPVGFGVQLTGIWGTTGAGGAAELFVGGTTTLGTSSGVVLRRSL